MTLRAAPMPAWMLALALALQALPPAAEADAFGPAGFKLDHYRDPVPDTLQGARVMHTAELQRFIAAARPILVDVLPDPTPPTENRSFLPRIKKPTTGLPGSLWLPETGRGAIAPTTLAYFKAGLAEATAGKADRPLVFYCLSQCWLSWNAAKRARALGYTDVVWYPDGADGWQAAGLPIQTLHPRP